jgi:uncharacterized protein with NRDE domain
MCLIVIAWHAHRDYPLIVAANRDEFFRRPTLPADWWKDAPHLLAGRDQQRGGTWLGVTRQGQFAAVTNYREPPSGPPAAESRGELVGNFLRGNVPPFYYLHEIAGRRANYDGFNLLVADGEQLWFLGKREQAPRELKPGIYGMSNGDLDARWPKVIKGKRAMEGVMQVSGGFALTARARERKRRKTITHALFTLLANRLPAADGDLPDTGIGLEWERMLSPIFVHADGYGTRSSTVVLADHRGIVHFHERSFGADGSLSGESLRDFQVQADAPRALDGTYPVRG